MTMLQARQRHPPRDLKAVEAAIRRLRRARLPSIRGISRRELRLIRRYALSNDPVTWEKIVTRRGVLSYSLLLHEQAEVDFFRQRGLDPLRHPLTETLYAEAHAYALRVEHAFLQRVAEQRGYRGLNLGTLVARNKSVSPRANADDVEIIQTYWGRKDAQVNEAQFSQADAFFAELVEE